MSGATPEYALQVARSPRAAQVVLSISDGELYQLTNKFLNARDLVARLTRPQGFSLSSFFKDVETGATLGGGAGGFGGAIGETAFGGETGGFGPAIGGVAGALSNLFPGPKLSGGTGRGQLINQFRPAEQPVINVAPLARRPSFIENLKTGFEAIPQAVESGVSLANQIGEFFNPPASTPQEAIPSQETPNGAASALQPYYENPSTEVLPQAQPSGSPYDNTSPIAAQFNFGPDETPPGPQGGGGETYPPPRPQQQGGDNFPVNRPQTGDCPQCDMIDRLRNQTNDEIVTEQQQQQQYDLQPQSQDVEQEISHISQQLSHLKSLENIPASQRDISSELSQKRLILHKLDKLKEKARKVVKEVRFCLSCEDQEQAMMFLNGEVAACNVLPGSATSGDGQPMLQPPDQPINKFVFGPEENLPQGFAGQPLHIARPIYEHAGPPLQAWLNSLAPDLRSVYRRGVNDALSGNPPIDPESYADSIGEMAPGEDLETIGEIYQQGYEEGHGGSAADFYANQD
jgi:hypothetical protein